MGELESLCVEELTGKQTYLRDLLWEGVYEARWPSWMEHAKAKTRWEPGNNDRVLTLVWS